MDVVADCSIGKRKRSPNDGIDDCKRKKTGVFEFFVVPDNTDSDDDGILGDGTFYIGQTLRIREGPLKGYLCRVLTLRRSESNNLVLTVTCELLDEEPEKSSANYTRMDPGSSSVRLFGMQDWREGAGIAENNEWNIGGASSKRSTWASLSTSSTLPFHPGSSPANPFGSLNYSKRASNQARGWGNSEDDWSKATTKDGSDKCEISLKTTEEPHDNRKNVFATLGSIWNSAASGKNQLDSDKREISLKTTEEPQDNGKNVFATLGSIWDSAASGKNQLDSWGKKKDVSGGSIGRGTNATSRRSNWGQISNQSSWTACISEQSEPGENNLTGENFGSRGRNWTWGGRSRGSSGRGGFGCRGGVNYWTMRGGRSGCSSDRGGFPGRGYSDRGDFGGRCGVSNWNTPKSFFRKWSSGCSKVSAANEESVGSGTQDNDWNTVKVFAGYWSSGCKSGMAGRIGLSDWDSKICGWNNSKTSKGEQKLNWEGTFSTTKETSVHTAGWDSRGCWGNDNAYDHSGWNKNSSEYVKNGEMQEEGCGWNIGKPSDGSPTTEWAQINTWKSASSEGANWSQKSSWNSCNGFKINTRKLPDRGWETGWGQSNTWKSTNSEEPYWSLKSKWNSWHASSTNQSSAGGSENRVDNFGNVHRGSKWGVNRGVRDGFDRGDFCSRCSSDRGGFGGRGFRGRDNLDRVDFGGRSRSDRGGFRGRDCWKHQSFSLNSCNGSGDEKSLKWGQLTNSNSEGWKADWNSSNSRDEKNFLDWGKQENSNGDRWEGSRNSSSDIGGKSSDWCEQANSKSDGRQAHDATEYWQSSIAFSGSRGSGWNQSALGNEASGGQHVKSSDWAKQAQSETQELTGSDAGNSWNERCSSTWKPPIETGGSQGSGWNQTATANETYGDHHEKSSGGDKQAHGDRQEWTGSGAGNSWNERCSSTWKPPIATGGSQGSGWNQTATANETSGDHHE